LEEAINGICKFMGRRSVVWGVDSLPKGILSNDLRVMTDELSIISIIKEMQLAQWKNVTYFGKVKMSLDQGFSF